jgi:hypothetical protein
MAREKISTDQKKSIARMDLHGEQFSLLSDILDVSETTVRKADKMGRLLNTIDVLNHQIASLEYANRSKNIQIMMLRAQKSAQSPKKSKSK